MSRGAAGGIGEKGAMDSSWTGVFFLGGGWTWIMRRSIWDWDNGWSDAYGRTDKLCLFPRIAFFVGIFFKSRNALFTGWRE